MPPGVLRWAGRTRGEDGKEAHGLERNRETGVRGGTRAATRDGREDTSRDAKARGGAPVSRPG